MKKKPVTIKVSPSIGDVSAEYLEATNTICTLTIAHGAGAGMNHSFLVELANGFAEERIATFRFNFPFAETGKKKPDFPAVAHKTIEAAIATIEKISSTPLFVSGKSFGGRMTSQFISANPNANINGIIFFGFPLHAVGKPSVERAVHLKDIQKPMLFLQGTRDALAQIDLIENVCASLPNAYLKKFEGADHSFKAGKQILLPGIISETKIWIQKCLESIR